MPGRGGRRLSVAGREKSHVSDCTSADVDVLRGQSTWYRVAGDCDRRWPNAGHAFLQPALHPRAAADPRAEARQWFEDAKFGLFVHWGVYSLLGKGEWVMENDKLPIREYAKLPPRFNPTRFDADCLGQAGQIGRREIHHGHRQAPRRLLHVRQQADRLRHRRRHSLSRRPAQGTGRRLPSREDQAFLLLFAARLAPPRLFSARVRPGKRRPRRQGDWKRVRRLLPGSGPRALHQLRRDRRHLVRRLVGQARRRLGPRGHLPVDPRAAARRLGGEQPSRRTICRRRFSDLRAGPARQQHGGVQQGQGSWIGCPLETCLTINRSWGYNARDTAYKSAEQIIHALLGAAGRGANLLLNVGPQPDGTIGPEVDSAAARSGQMARRLRSSRCTARAGGRSRPSRGESRPPRGSPEHPDKIYLHVFNQKDTTSIMFDPSFSWTPYLFGKPTPLTLKQTKGGLVLELPIEIRLPIDTIIVLSPKPSGR